MQALDARFKAKMAGLASRFKQLEEEEAKVQMMKQENEVAAHLQTASLPTRMIAPRSLSLTLHAPLRVGLAGGDCAHD